MHCYTGSTTPSFHIRSFSPRRSSLNVRPLGGQKSDQDQMAGATRPTSPMKKKNQTSDWGLHTCTREGNSISSLRPRVGPFFPALDRTGNRACLGVAWSSCTAWSRRQGVRTEWIFELFSSVHSRHCPLPRIQP